MAYLGTWKKPLAIYIEAKSHYGPHGDREGNGGIEPSRSKDDYYSLHILDTSVSGLCPSVWTARLWTMMVLMRLAGDGCQSLVLSRIVEI